MKLKYPKKVKISHNTFTIRWDRKSYDGEVSWAKQQIMIGTKSKDAPTILGTIIHELKEVIQMGQCVEYVIPGTDDNFKFVYGHAEHTDLCDRLAGLLDEFIK